MLIFVHFHSNLNGGDANERTSLLSHERIFCLEARSRVHHDDELNCL